MSVALDAARQFTVMSGTIFPPQTAPAQSSQRPVWLRVLWVLFLLFIFLCAIRGMGSGFKGLGKDALDSFFAATSNPFVGLVVGILGTTLVQSSSVTTSMIVALVAAPGNPLPIANAIPMIMGANIGTTVTNTIVALAHIGRPDEFKRAFAAATCHDFFNFIAVAILLPLEIATGMLQKASYQISQVVGVGGGGKLPNPIKAGTKAVVKPIKAVIEELISSPQLASIVLVVISVVVIFVTLGYIVRTLRDLSGAKMQVFLTRSLGSNAYTGIVVGIIVTVAVQSSSITTSILVPLSGAGMISLEQVFPITLGANIGTTITAILASMAAPEETAALAVQIATVHLLFNMVGIMLIYPLTLTRQIPLQAARWLANVAVGSRKTAIFYVLGLFYALPAVLIAVSKLLGS